ncbi:MAG: TrkA family potassium uptake protein [Erysipelotrichaceae bacterium]|jgi:trk system potassium uptake protein TrkA|nr:TrkA family potassium uptake protein [Erysipelotrichaceae bacterium]
MKNILVIGAGRFGRYTIRKLHDMGHQVLVIDRNESRINKILSIVRDARIGDSTDPEFMGTLGVRDYDLCIVAIGDDFLASLETVFLLNELGAARVIARATSGSQEKFLLRNGAEAVVYPERQLGSWTAIRYSSDNISNYIELSDGYSIFEMEVPMEWDQKKIGEINIRRRYNLNILGIKDPRMNMNITNDTVLHHGQSMLVLGRYENVQKIFSL